VAGKGVAGICGVLVLQRYFDRMLCPVGQTFQPAMRTLPQSSRESLLHGLPVLGVALMF
jgi:hypothetical protein